MPEKTNTTSQSSPASPGAQLAPSRSNNRIDRHIARVGLIIGLMLIAGCFIILMGAQQKAPAASQTPAPHDTASPMTASPTPASPSAAK